MKITKSMGPITEPCGIPLITMFYFDATPCTFADCVLPLKKDRIQFMRSPLTPILSNFTINLSCAKIYIVERDKKGQIAF